MEVKNKLYPSRDQMKGFFEVADDEDNDKPIYMVNLLKFKKKAEYRDGRKTNLTGIEAYQKYAEIITKHIEELGGEITFSSKIKRMTVGKITIDAIRFIPASYVNKWVNVLNAIGNK